MKIFLLCLAMLLLADSFVFADKIIVSQDSLIDPTDFKHDKQYFLDHYGKDDSTKALINTFFRVRREAVVETVFGSIVTTGSVVLLSSPDAFLLFFAFAPIIATAAILIIDGPITTLVYTRKKLLHFIADYQTGKHLPRRFTHRLSYKRELRKVKGIKPTIWNILFST